MSQQGEGNITKTPQIDKTLNAGESNISEPQTGTNTVQQQFKGAAQLSDNLYRLLNDAIKMIKEWIDILSHETLKNKKLLPSMEDTHNRLLKEIEAPNIEVKEFNENIMDSPSRISQQSNYSDALQILSDNKQFLSLHDKIKFMEDMFYRDTANLPPLSPPQTPKREKSEKNNDKSTLYKQALSQIGSEVSELELNFKKHKDEAKILNETFAQDFQEFSRDSSQMHQQNISVLDIPQQSINLASFDKSNLYDQYSEIKKNFRLSIAQLKQKYNKTLKDLFTQVNKLKNQRHKLGEFILQQINQQKEFNIDRLNRIVDAYSENIAQKEQENLNLKNQHQLAHQQIELQMKYDILQQKYDELQTKSERKLEEDDFQEIIAGQDFQQLNEEIENLKQFNKQLVTEIKKLKDLLEQNSENTNNEEIIQSNNALKNSIRQLQLECENLQKQNSDLSKSAHNSLSNYGQQQTLIKQQEDEIQQLRTDIEQLSQFNQKLVNENQQMKKEEQQNKRLQKCENCIIKEQKISEWENFQQQLENLDSSSDEDVPDKKKKQKKTADSKQKKNLIKKSIKWLQTKLKEELTKYKLQYSNNPINDFTTLITSYNNLQIAFEATKATINQFQTQSKQEWLILKNENNKLIDTQTDLQNQLKNLNEINRLQSNKLQEQQNNIAQQQHNLMNKDEEIIKQKRDINQLISENKGYHRQVIQNDKQINQYKNLIDLRESLIQKLQQLQEQFIKGFNDQQGDIKNVFESQFRIISEYYGYFDYTNSISATQVQNQSARVFNFRIQNQNEFEKQFELQKKSVQELWKQVVERQNAFVATIERERNELE